MLKTINKIKNYLIYPLLLLLLISLGLNFYFINNLRKQSNNSSQKNKIATVTRVIDGDTFETVELERVRLYEIDAPEYPKGCMGTDAKVRLENLILNKNVEMIDYGKDNFGRMLAYVFLDKLLLNEILIEEGSAYFYKGKNTTAYSLGIEKAEEKARLSGRGVWSSLCQSKKDGCVIKGNYRSADNTRIYHTPDCYNYDKITIKPGTTDRWFCSEEEATKAGFIKSLDCPKK